MPTAPASEYTRRLRLLAVQSGPRYPKGQQNFVQPPVSAIGLVNFLPNVRGYPLTIVPSAPTPEPPTGFQGSMQFAAGGQLVQTNVSYPNDANLRPGTGKFTVEWFQYYQDSDMNAIVFSIGTSPTNDLCVVYVGTTMFLITDGSATSAASAVTKNVWQHIAVVGNGGADGSRNVKVYVNGELKLTRTANYNINQTDALRIGNQSNPTLLNGNYAGLITNFRWVVGTEVYTNAFTAPTTPLTAIPGTELLLLATSPSTAVADSSIRNRTPNNTGVIYSSSVPV
jgi:hypothetical protein